MSRKLVFSIIMAKKRKYVPLHLNVVEDNDDTQLRDWGEQLFLTCEYPRRIVDK